jgi:tetratricopeptide (TPR) repeat protein
LAVDLFAQDEALPTFSIARMASFAAPGNDDARVTVARAALNADYAAEAYAEASMVPPASPAWFDAQIGQVRALVDQGQATEAAARAEALVRQDGGSARAWRLLGDVRVRRDDFAGAAEAYGQARKALGDREDPSLLLQLGGALEQAGDWAAARPLLVRVVELAPDSAAALNHLGYALADRGETLPQAIALLEKANRIRPNVPAYVDSLGWAFFRSGQYARALPLIESAAADDPANGELSEHLGDVLWAMGRRFEARYAWKAALAGLDGGDGPAALRARLTRKLDGGAPVAGAR